MQFMAQLSSQCSGLHNTFSSDPIERTVATVSPQVGLHSVASWFLGNLVNLLGVSKEHANLAQ